MEGWSEATARSCLVIGGARSGKSTYAQRLAEASGLAPVYLATATIGDAEMRDRVTAHQAARDARWTTREEPLALAEALAGAAGSDAVVLVDCLTLWLTNLILGDHDVDAATRPLLALIPSLPGPVVFVSNEVGTGIVPDNALARRFRDAQGRLNQQVAAACDAVVLVTAGLPLRLKPADPPGLRIR
jgi:adenosylcobinamide kinase / adenosylcobinamide-phosphate guanylyltransferase